MLGSAAWIGADCWLGFSHLSLSGSSGWRCGVGHVGPLRGNSVMCFPAKVIFTMRGLEQVWLRHRSLLIHFGMSRSTFCFAIQVDIWRGGWATGVCWSAKGFGGRVSLSCCCWIFCRVLMSLGLLGFNPFKKAWAKAWLKAWARARVADSRVGGWFQG
jgi:hypothetical protein